MRLVSSTDKTPAKVLDQRLMREVKIHAELKHPNILELLRHEGDSREGPGRPEWGAPCYFIALELAEEGDLFDKIAPNAGVDEPVAHFFFCQLLRGLSHLHKCGIAHRDLKPGASRRPRALTRAENILLSTTGNAKLSDFGLSAVFRYKGQQRLLNDACGSPPYVAPELALGQQYRAEPVDVWSLGVLLFTLLLGNTPWDIPTSASGEYSAYLEGKIFQYDPWPRLSKDQLCASVDYVQTDAFSDPRQDAAPRSRPTMDAR